MEPTMTNPEPIRLQALATEVEADAPARTITGRITVFNTIAESHGLIINAGALQPREPFKRVKLLRDHDMAQPVGYMTQFAQGDQDATATFYVPEGPDGDRALAEAQSGLRDGLSVGFMPTDYEFDDDWNLVVRAAELYEVSLCAVPAFQDAQVESVAAAVAFAKKQKELNMTDQTTAPVPPAAPAAPPAPAALSVPAVPAGPAALGQPAAPAMTERQQLMSRIAEGRNVQLALDPIIQADVFDAVTVPAFIGELWAGRGYFQRYAPLITKGTLTGQDMIGWRWVTTPEVDDYAGNLAEVPTNVVQAESVPFTASRVASGHKIDRIHVDLPNPAFWNSFYKERTDNYARLMDGKVLTHLTTLANHTAVVDATTDPWEKLIVGAQNVLEFAVPDFAIVGADLYRELALTTDVDKLAFLGASLGLEEGSLAGFRIVGAPPSATGLNGKVIVGAAAATTLYELPGGPIRVEALDVAHGGIDAGLFGYYSLFTNDKRGIVSVNVA
jgi:HK97 family phage prohead protease